MPRHANRVAKSAANYVNRFVFERHRGTIWWTPKRIALFGNDGYEKTNWVRNEVAFLRQLLQTSGASESGFGVSDDGYSWALLIPAPVLDRYETDMGRRFQMELIAEDYTDLVWKAWDKATSQI